MKIYSVGNYNYNTPKYSNNKNVQKPVSQMSDNVNFAGNDNKKSPMSKTRSAAIGLVLLPIAGGMLTGCEKDEPFDDYPKHWSSVRDTIEYGPYEYHRWEYIDTIKPDTIILPNDTIIKWPDFERPQPLDTLFLNLGNWGIVDGDGDDPTSARNIIHYEGDREWEENDREIGDMNYHQSSKKVLVYDTEIKDYKGNHKSYGKSVLRIPDSEYTVITKDGRTLHTPKGIMVESWVSNSNKPGADFTSCTPLKRDFCVTIGDSLRVAKEVENGVFKEAGTVSKGYLDNTSLLFKDLIGIYSTDDHLRKFEVDVVDDKTLQENYIKAMDDRYGKK